MAKIKVSHKLEDHKDLADDLNLFWCRFEKDKFTPLTLSLCFRKLNQGRWKSEVGCFENVCIMASHEMLYNIHDFLD